MTGNLGMEGTGTKKLHLWELQRDRHIGLLKFHSENLKTETSFFFFLNCIILLDVLAH